MLWPNEDDDAMRRPWPPSAVVLFVLGFAAVVFLGFHYMRGISLWGLTQREMSGVTAAIWATTWALAWLIVRRSAMRSP